MDEFWRPEFGFDQLLVHENVIKRESRRMSRLLVPSARYANVPGSWLGQIAGGRGTLLSRYRLRGLRLREQ